MNLKILRLALLGWINFKLDPIKIEELKSLKEEQWSDALYQMGYKKLASFVKNHPKWYLNYLHQMKWLKDHEMKIIHFWDHAYPDSLKEIHHPPLLLSYLGSNEWLNSSCLGIVGSRNPSINAINWLDNELAIYLKKKKTYVISGGARGVDQKSHLVSLRCNNPTVIFTPSGLKYLYPKELKNWVRPVLQSGGAIVSQFAPFDEMRKHYFHLRNALIAMFSEKIIIIEAKRKSGTLITAKLGLEFGKELKVLPCSPYDASGLGSLDLIFDGASILRDAFDI